jgi:type IV pilus assembly protein PilO
MDKLVERYAKLGPRERYGGLAAVIVLLLAAYWYVIYSEQASRLEKLQKQYDALEQQRAQTEGYVQNLAKYEARLNELQGNLNEARAQLPDEADVPQLLAQLDNRARQAGLAISRFEPKAESPKDFYAEIGFDMDVKGSYHEIATFIDSVGKLDRIVNVSDITMKEPKTVNQKVVVASDFIIKTYRFLPELTPEQQAEAAKAKEKEKGKKKKPAKGAK